MEISSLDASIALHDVADDACVGIEAAELPPGHRQLESLIPTLESLLNRHGLSPSSISGCTTSRGPGSFTGLRTAFASLKGIALANRAAFETIDSSEVRVLDFLEGRENLPGSDLFFVLSELSPKKIVVSRFERCADDRVEKSSVMLLTQEWQPDPRGLILIPRPETRSQLGSHACVVHPLHASAFLRVKGRSKTRVIYRDAKEISLAAPDYYATGFSADKKR